MNIEVFGRARPVLRGETAATPVYKVSENTVEVTGTSHSFSQWYDDLTSNEDVYKDCMAQMVDLFLTGYNLSFICLGDTQSGRSYTLVGDNQTKMGLVHFAVQDLLKNIKEATEGLLPPVSHMSVNMKMWEVYNEVIRDLLQMTADQPGELGCTTEDWYHVKNARSVPVADEDDVFLELKNGWKRRTSSHEKSEDKDTVIIQFEAVTTSDQFGYPHRSLLTLVDLPALVNWKPDGRESRNHENIELDKTLDALKQFVEGLNKSQDQGQTSDFSESKAVSLFQDSFGGNAKTKAMVHFKQSSKEDTVKHLLQFSGQLSQVKNYFVLNDIAAQGLIKSLRAKQLSLQRQLGAQSSQATGDRDQSGSEVEMSKVIMENKYLSRKLDRLENQFGDVVAAKEDLSSRLISSEEERLRASRALVDFKIENSQERDGLLQENFELKNKLMSCESQLLQERANRRRASDNTSQTHHLALRCAELEDNYAALMRKYHQEMKRNQELGMELLNLLNAEVALLQQQGNLKNSETEDLRKIKDIALGLTADREKVSDVPVRDLASILSGDSGQFRRENEKMKALYEQQQSTLEKQIQGLNEAVNKSKVQALEAQKKVAQQEVELMMKKEQTKEMERQISGLHLQIKEKNEEHRRRLQKYLDDIADFVEKNSKSPNARQVLRGTVDQINDDLKQTFHNREKQLSDAARSYRQQAQRVAKKHEALLVAYRLLRQQVGDAGDIDLGPEEHEMSLSEASLESSNRKQLTELEAKLNSVTSELQTMKDNGVSDKSLEIMKATFQGQQEEIEKERASLLASNALLEEQLAESMTYIKKEIPRYREEIQNLRYKLGISDQYYKPPRAFPQF